MDPTQGSQQTPPDLPLPANINLVALFTAAASILGIFHIAIPPEVISTAASVAVGIVALVTFILHTYVNHPANIAKTKVLVANATMKATAAARKGTPIILGFILAGGLFLGGCATMGIGTSSSQKAYLDLADAEIVATASLQGLITVCHVGDATAAAVPAFCSDAGFRSNAKKAADVMAAAFNSANVIATGNLADPASIENAVTAALLDYQAWGHVTQPVASAKKAGIDVNAVITIATVGLQIALQVYQQIQAMQSATSSAGVTTSQLTQLNAGLQTANSTIQAW